MRRPTSPHPESGYTGFNPHPAQRPDATLATAMPHGSLVFQPSSSPKAGCDVIAYYRDGTSYMFQPSSSPKAGCDALHGATAAMRLRVSTLIQPKGRMRRHKLIFYSEYEDVSTLIQPKGRMRRHAGSV